MSSLAQPRRIWWELASVLPCALTLACWNAVALGYFSVQAFGFFAVLVWTSARLGRSAGRWVDERFASDFPTAFLFGFLLLNTGLLLLARISPTSIVTNAMILLAVVLIVAWRWPGPPLEFEPERDRLPTLILVVLSLVGATLLSLDAIHAQIVLPDGVILKPWLDSFFHARMVQEFRDQVGPVTIHDPRLANQPMWFYHHGSYLTTALLSRVTGTPAFLAYSSFQTPFGVVLSGFAAYALARSLWGARAGLAGAAALLLLPDGAWHGFADAGLSYNWLQQIAPAGQYGVAVLAVAWLLMFEGCRTGRNSLIGLAFLCAGLVVQYKAHLFVASSLFIWVYPGLSLQHHERRWKFAWLVFALTSFFAVILLARQVESIPVLKLDGSALKHYVGRHLSWVTTGSVRAAFESRMTAQSPLLSDLVWGGLFLSYGTFGAWGLAVLLFCLVTLLRRPRCLSVEQAVFPVLVMLIYLVMSLGLAYNDRPPAHPEELLHRPLVWAYFIVATWFGCELYLFLIEPIERRSQFIRRGLLCVLGLACVIPWWIGRNVQVGPDWGRALTNQAYPRGWFDCALYLRDHARPEDVIQDADGDPKLMLGALSEHQSYAIDYFDTHRPPELTRRLEALEVFKQMTDPGVIARFAASRGIHWYVTHPDSRLRWPGSILSQPAFCSHGFCVYQFQESGMGLK